MCVAELCLRLQDFDFMLWKEWMLWDSIPTKLSSAIRKCSPMVQIICVTTTELAIEGDSS
jgi:hypothetical protein